MRLFISLSCLFFLFACDSDQQKTAEQKPDLESPIMLTGVENSEYDFSAHWIRADLILLPKSSNGNTYHLAKYPLAGEDDSGSLQSIALEKIELPMWAAEKFPHLKAFQAYRVGLSLEDTKQWLKALPFVIVSNKANAVSKIAYAQTGFVLDDIYTKDDNDADEVSDYGATLSSSNVTFKLWAPTAQAVRVLLFDENKFPLNPAYLDMHENTDKGVWQVQGDTSLNSTYYQYEITLYHDESRKLETVATTDPYSLSLSSNSVYSQVVNLDDEKIQPSGWSEHEIPSVENPEDNVIYEVHIRDFSSADPLLSESSVRGKYKAFSENASAGIKHLKSLRAAGLNNIHLLPAFDIGTIEEDESRVIDLNDPLSKVCNIAPHISLCDSDEDKNQTLLELLNSFEPHTPKAQVIINEIKALDNYNWGYDPYHYTVPEGSYANNPEGEARIVEFREMVQSLHGLGFRVIMDVVYNHTHQAGLAEKSVLDKIVPNYYHRLNPVSGAVERSTCCDNTATERVMMAKLMTDSLVVWARDYKIDGFRFDLMGHQPKAVMLDARQAVRAFDPDTYFYGEGWNFGEVANGQRFVQASQLKLGGSEIGTYSDRMRDSVRGCCFNSESNDIRKNQGIGNGLGTAANNLQVDSTNEQYHLLLNHLRLGLAGNLANYPIVEAGGNKVLGKDIPYGNDPAAYALDPADTINYVSKHDNQTLWDNNQYRNPFELSTADRVRMHNQNLSYVLLAQGIPFLHMGAELLRSKSFLRDSYDYGDWFNRVDFTKQSNFYNVGLPPSEKDKINWPLIENVLSNNEGRDLVSPGDIQFSADVFNEFLAIRMSSALFRMTTSEDVIHRLKFHNTGKNHQSGLIIMSIDGNEEASSIMLVFNFGASLQTFAFNGADSYTLHRIQKEGVDSRVKQSKSTAIGFTVPAYTTAVFVK